MINGGFGLVLDGSADAEERAKMMLNWDVSNGVSTSACFEKLLLELCIHIQI